MAATKEENIISTQTTQTAQTSQPERIPESTIRANAKVRVAPPVPAHLAGKMVNVLSSDGKTLTFPVEVLYESRTLQQMLDSTVVSDIPIALPASEIIRAMAFCKQLSESHGTTTDRENQELSQFDNRAIIFVADWQKKFIEPFAKDFPALFAMLHTANFLDIQQLMNLAAYTAATSMRGFSTEQMREVFGIKDPGFTPEEKAKLQADDEWLAKLV